MVKTPHIDNNKPSLTHGREVINKKGINDNWIVCVEDTTNKTTIFKEHPIFLTYKKVVEMREFCKQKKVHVLQYTLRVYSRDGFAVSMAYFLQKIKLIHVLQ